jgi:hypothetical protein
VSVVVHPTVGDQRLELGELDRLLSVTAGGYVQQIPVKGIVRGEVWLDDDRNDIELASFRGPDGTVQEFNLSTEQAKTGLAVVPAECKPSYYSYELVRQPDRGARGYYKLRITVKPGEQVGRPRGGAVVVLEVKGPKPQTIRIPVQSIALP